MGLVSALERNIPTFVRAARAIGRMSEKVVMYSGPACFLNLHGILHSRGTAKGAEFKPGVLPEPWLSISDGEQLDRFGEIDKEITPQHLVTPADADRVRDYWTRNLVVGDKRIEPSASTSSRIQMAKSEVERPLQTGGTSKPTTKREWKNVISWYLWLPIESAAKFVRNIFGR
jgi:hypothetical protein